MKKFWEAAIETNKLIVRFGRTGTKGQTQIKTFADETAAEKEKSKLVRAKMLKGYVQINCINWFTIFYEPN